VGEDGRGSVGDARGKREGKEAIDGIGEGWSVHRCSIHTLARR